MIVFPGFVPVEFDLEAVAVGIHRLDRRKRGVSLAADRDVLHRFVVDHHCAYTVFLVLTGLKESVPVVDHDVNGVDAGGVEQRLFIAHRARRRFQPQRLSAHEQDGQDQAEDEDDNADAVYVFMR